jgi:putative protein-disulfide isomerase
MAPVDQRSGMTAELFYIHDPMCSWCWGFAQARKKLFESVPENVTIRRLLGGLAADDDQPMSASMQQYIQQNWRRIENEVPGLRFNFDFWHLCQPRRSTYPACRAVIAARQQGDEYDEAMTERIQQAYYEEAKNPSDNETLIELAADLGLDEHRFSIDINADTTEQVLKDEIQLSTKLHAESLPSLVLKVDDTVWPVAIDYLDASPMLQLIEMLSGDS